MVMNLQVELSNPAKKYISSFFTLMHLLGIIEAKSVLICGLHLHLKQMALAGALSNGFKIYFLPFVAEAMGLIGMTVSTYSAYVLFRCRVASYRRKKALTHVLATTGSADNFINVVYHS